MTLLDLSAAFDTIDCAHYSSEEQETRRNWLRRHCTGLNHISKSEDQARQVSVLHISSLFCSSPGVTSLFTLVSCVFPLHQATLLQR